MDCRDFRDKHLDFVDDTLAGVELVGMQVHMTECESCSRHDAIVRRSLMLFRSLPTIEPSQDFSFRLQQKLNEVKRIDALQGSHAQPNSHTQRNHKVGAAMAAASILMLAYIGTSLRRVDVPQDIVLPPVVAIADLPSAVNAPETVASVSAGMPIWTAALFAEQTQVHFASMELASLTR